MSILLVMERDANDDELLSFQSLGLAAAIVINRIRIQRTLLEFAEDEKEQRDRDTGRDRTDEQRTEDQRRYVDQRLREMAAFERKVSGNKN